MASSHQPHYRVFVRNLRYDVQKWEVRKVLEDDYGIFSCSDIKLTRMDQWGIPQHCSGYLYISDVTWNLFMWKQICLKAQFFFTCVVFFQSHVCQHQEPGQ